LIRLPQGEHYPTEDVELSPPGDRLAWLIHIMAEPSLVQRMLSRWMPWLEARSHIELRTTKLDGSDVNRIGYIELHYLQPYEDDYAGPGGLRWLPDGRRLSFVYQGGLWTVPVR
jgi:hypothetical protein